ncbi:lantibiotic dehydratase, partial [Planomonospora algeriensis]
METASPALLEGLDRAGEPGAPADRRRRAHAALLRYLTRMSTRPTPYGCFAGVAIGELDDRTDLRLGAEGFARERVRPDMGWLMALVKRVETGPGAPGAEVVWNALAHRSGERVVLPQADVYGQSDRRAIRIRWTPAVQAVMDLTVTPAPYEKVRRELAAAFPDAAPERLSALLAKLLELNYLMSSLRPPLTRPAPQEHVLERLDAAGGPCAAVADELREVRRLA